MDTGTPCIWAARHISYGRDRRMVGSFTWASMANASPNAFGAALSFPGRQAIALCGDGGFTMLFSQVATALGARGIRVEEPGDVRDAMQAALAHTGVPVVVDMVVDRYALSLPSHIPAATAKGFTLSIAKQVLSGKMDDVIETVEHNVRLL